MFEVGVIHNGALDLPVKRDKGTVYISGNLADGHASAQRVLNSQVRQAVLADRLGFDYWWMTEHHFQPEGAEFSPNPIVAETAIAALTKRIRLGQMANILTQHHPVRIAEQAAMLDVISGGRLEFGIGRGYQPREVELFARTYGSSVQDQERNRAYFEEAFEIILKCWTEVSFSHRGQFFTIPPSYAKWHHKQTLAFFSQPGLERSVEDILKIGAPSYDPIPVLAQSTTLKEISVYPQPLQKPHPQVWQPATSPRSIRWAAANCLNAIIDVDTDLALKRDIDIYYGEAEKQGWPDRLGRGAFKRGWDSDKRRGLACGRFIHIVDSGIGDLKRAKDGLEMQWDFYGPFGFAGALANPEDPPIDLNMKVTPEFVMDQKVALYGNKELIIEGLLNTKRVAGYEDFCVVLAFELAGFESRETEEQMQCFAEEILPVLKKELGGGTDLPASTADLGLDQVAVVESAARKKK